MSQSRPTPALASDSPDGIGFLLSQIGSHCTTRFAERLQPLGLKPAHARALRTIRQVDGSNQQALGERLGIFASRLVGIIDELEKLGFVERRSSPTDRRSYALHLTEAGQAAVATVQEVSRAVQEEICTALDETERTQFAALLGRIAAEQGLQPGVHPALSQADAEMT